MLPARFVKIFDSVLYYCFEYLCGNVSINTLIIIIRILLTQKTENIYYTLNIYSDFAVKYLLLVLVIAVSAPSIEKYFRENITFSITFPMDRRIFSDEVKKCFVNSYAVFMVLHHFIGLFDNSFWADEGILVNIARRNWTEIWEAIVSYGHSPFHYVVSWLGIYLLGESGFTYHFLAALPYFIIIFIAATVIKKWFSKKTAVILITLCFLLENAVKYNLEIRMYAWCQLFILLTYLMSYKLLKSQENKYYILMAIFSLGAVYTHYFSLAAVGLLYFVIFIYVIKTNIKEIWKILLSGISILGLLLPWLAYAKKVKGVVGIYWDRGCMNL